MLCHLRDTNSLLLSCHLEIGPKPVDDTFTLNFAEWLEKSLTMLETSGITSKTMNIHLGWNAFHLQGSIIC
jgi:hypothetical protein